MTIEELDALLNSGAIIKLTNLPFFYSRAKDGSIEVYNYKHKLSDNFSLVNLYSALDCHEHYIDRINIIKDELDGIINE